jgi:hypothetical protein
LLDRRCFCTSLTCKENFDASLKPHGPAERRSSIRIFPDECCSDTQNRIRCHTIYCEIPSHDMFNKAERSRGREAPSRSRSGWNSESGPQTTIVGSRPRRDHNNALRPVIPLPLTVGSFFR